MCLRNGFCKVTLKIILTLIVIAIPNLVLMSCVQNIRDDGCDSLGSGLRINIEGDGEDWLFKWSGNRINRIERQRSVYSWEDFKYRLNVQRSTGDKRSSKLPQDLIGAGKRFDVPFAVSHNGQMLISSIYPDQYILRVSERYAIINLNNRKLLRVIDAGYYVLSLAWSPADKYFAVLSSQRVSGQIWNWPGDLLSGLFGHPRQYYTLYVDIYNLEGEMVCRKLLIEKLLGGFGYLDWE